MSKFVINIQQGENTFTAGSKSVIDFIEILSKNEVKPLHYPYMVGASKFIKLKHLLKDSLNCLCQIKRGDIIIYIYPDILSYEYLFSLISLKRHKSVALVCDINSMRSRNTIYNKNNLPIVSKKEAKILNRFTYILAHTPAMRDGLIEGGVEENKIIVMEFIDYLAKKGNTLKRENNQHVCYAGNLDKSNFIESLIPIAKNSSTQFYLYGVNNKGLEFGDNIYYKGKFHPNDLSALYGNWGLVWDGDSANSCTGEMGNYLRVNIPHKTTLYIAAQMPIIIWDKSALASFILDNKLGITISSLEDIPNRLSQISDNEYNQYLNNVKNFKFNYLENCIKNIII